MSHKTPNNTYKKTEGLQKKQSSPFKCSADVNMHATPVNLNVTQVNITYIDGTHINITHVNITHANVTPSHTPVNLNVTPSHVRHVMPHMKISHIKVPDT